MAPILGECPISSYMKFDGLNEGVGAGRSCWMAPHLDPADGDNSGGCATRKCYCCEFYKRVVFEQEERTCFKFTSIDE